MVNNKILLVNLIILALYMVTLTIMHGGAILITSILPIFAQVFINFLLFIFSNDDNKIKSRSYLLSALLILLIGFSSCWGISSIAGGPKF